VLNYRWNLLLNQCNDGYYGNGACQCDAAYTGAECEFCSNLQMYGPNCSTGESPASRQTQQIMPTSASYCSYTSKTHTFNSQLNAEMRSKLINKQTRLKSHKIAVHNVSLSVVVLASKAINMLSTKLAIFLVRQ